MSLSVRIKKKLGDFLLEVELEAADERMALLGASGSGKSMTLKCIAGIETPDEGRIVVNGRTLFDSERRINLPPQKRRVGYLFQEYALFPNMTVFENIAVGVRADSRGEKRKRTKQLIQKYRLEGLETLHPHQLSGGQKQRTALARMLAAEPELLLFDEPLSALDSHLRWQLELELNEVLQDFPGTAVVVTHDRREAERLCSTVTLLDYGKTADRGSFAVLENPKTLCAARLAGCRNISAAEWRDESHVFCRDWGITLVAEGRGERCRCVGLPELKPAEDGEGFLCTVSSVMQTGDEITALLRPSQDADGELCMVLHGEKIHPEQGEQLCVRAEKILLLREKN